MADSDFGPDPLAREYKDPPVVVRVTVHPTITWPEAVSLAARNFIICLRRFGVGYETTTQELWESMSAFVTPFAATIGTEERKGLKRFSTEEAALFRAAMNLASAYAPLSECAMLESDLNALAAAACAADGDGAKTD